MSEILTAAQMGAAERFEMERGTVTGLELMERAGRGVVDTLFARWPELAQAPKRAIVLCGPGNNGGDGFVVARLLKGWGWEIDLFLYGDAARLKGDAATNCARWKEIGAVRAVEEIADEDALLELEAAVFVDALFGTGLTRPVEARGTALGAFFDLTEARHADYGPKVVSVDLPSGLCSDSGRVLGAAIRADLTVSFHALKRGHLLSDGPFHCGRVAVVDIGLPSPHRQRLSPDVRDGLPEDQRLCLFPVTAPLGRLGKGGSGHKYSHGHALVLTGGAGRTGAARLAARAALRVGAGLVTLGVPGAAQQEVACQITALMLRRIEDAAGLSAALEDPRLTSLCLGPGLGIERARALVPAALSAGPGRRVVLDADALTAFDDAPEDLFAMLHEDVVLTPHRGEFTRLFPDLAEALSKPADRGPALSRVDVARAAASRAGAVLLLKGPDTVIAAPNGACVVHAAAYARSAPWLATAGSGDVLAGLICGLMARGMTPFMAAQDATWLHVEAARRFGPGLISEDLPEMIPAVLADLEERA
ncbi:NAD(P)H-hydrate dehydratase [Litorisediminicola beolgyonensis]|uniref:Bifunctional NAD(P)H-hydrate repair enzyme n=1 Tax=Litorisediminicola beolgyonensis TaxID=1173614 RepID=A0ABW3ZF06_9RHOB